MNVVNKLPDKKICIGFAAGAVFVCAISSVRTAYRERRRLRKKVEKLEYELWKRDAATDNQHR